MEKVNSSLKIIQRDWVGIWKAWLNLKSVKMDLVSNILPKNGTNAQKKSLH